MLHYLILAHNNFDQLEMLVNKIKTNNSKIHIHIDKKVKDFPRFKDVEYIEDRQDIRRWWNMILKAELTGIFQIHKHMKEWDHVAILSWVCFPIKKVDYIEEYISSLKDKSSFDYYQAPEYVKRWITDYWFYDIDFHIPSYVNNLMIKIISRFKKIDPNIKLSVINFLLSKIVSFILPKRKYIADNYMIKKWSAWVVLSYKHIKYLIEFFKTEKWKKVLKCFNNTNIPDETFFQTVLLDLVGENEINNRCLWFMIWEKWASCPICLTSDNLDEIRKSDKLFARKFDIRRDRRVLETLNNI